MNTLKEQLAEERAERTKMRETLELAHAAQQQGFAQLQAAHEAAADASGQSRAAEVTSIARRGCRELHGRLVAFCEKWVPSGAETEKVVILEGLRELEELLAAGRSPRAPG